MLRCIIGNRLRDLLRIREGVDAFREHLQSEFSGESIDFYLEVAKVDAQRSITLDQARSLYRQFISPDAAQQVNIAGATSERIRASIDGAVRLVIFVIPRKQLR